MQKKSVVAITLLSLFTGYILADVSDVVPGVLTVGENENAPLPYPELQVPSPEFADFTTLNQDVTWDAPPANEQQIAQALTELAADPALAGDTLGAIVIDALSGKVLAQHHSEQALSVASLTKIATAVAWLESFNPAHRFTTSAYQVDNTIYVVPNGDILLGMGAGDLTAVNGHAGLQDLAEQIAEKIAQNAQHTQDPVLQIVEGYWQGTPYHPHFPESDIAPWVMPMVSGAINRAQIADYTYHSSPLQQLGETLATQLAEQGVAVSGVQVVKMEKQERIKLEKLPLLGEIKSATLSEITALMLQTSDNSLAEVGGALIADKADFSPDFAGSSAGVQAVLSRLGLTSDTLSLVDASGLNLANKMSAQDVGNILHYLWQCQQCKAKSAGANLAVSQISGTLAGRYHGVGLTANIHAKTGTLPTVSSLAGYLLTKANRPLIFAVIVNHREETAPEPVRAAIDSALTKITVNN